MRLLILGQLHKIGVAVGLGLLLSGLGAAGLFFMAGPAQARITSTVDSVQPTDSLSPRLQAAISETISAIEMIPSNPAGVDGSSLISGPAYEAQPSPPLPAWIEQARRQANEDVSALAANLIVTNAAAATVLNGSTILYTITITNVGDSAATQITLADVPPVDTLQSSITCSDCTQAITRTQTITGAGFFGANTLVLVYTDLITWFIPSLPAGGVAQKTFSVTVPCKAEGELLLNQAFVNYQQGNGASNQTSTRVVVSNSQAGVVDEPGWCAEKTRNAFNLDWGDFDRDGYVDMVLATSLGTTVFRNNNGQLTEFWRNSTPAFDTRWGDFDGDGDLDIVSIGNAANHYIHKYTGTTFETSSFTAADGQGFRVEPGNFDNNPDLELVISTNFNTACSVRLYNNNGAGTFSPDAGCLQANFTSAGLAAADFNNDGDLDLAINRFGDNTNREVRILLNNGANIAATNFISFSVAPLLSPYGMVWGDYDNDGWLDLAIAYPLSGGSVVQVYQNQNGTGFSFIQAIPTANSGFGPPFSVDWADFNGDRHLDLLIPDLPPKVYAFNNNTFSLLKALPDAGASRIWQARSADHDQDGDLDLAYSGTFVPSRLHPNIGAFLGPTISPVNASVNASAVAWGDADGDGDLDLLFGAGGTGGALAGRLYDNSGGAFTLSQQFTASGFGPHAVAFADVNADGALDITIGTLNQTQIYLNGNNTAPDVSLNQPATTLAWADLDLDNPGRLDLLSANDSQYQVTINTSTGSLNAGFTQSINNIQSLAWGDFDGDDFLDFAVGRLGQPSQVYRNNGDRTFSLAWTAPEARNTRSVAWGDYDNDGRMDLALGNEGQANQIYRNTGSGFSLTWSAPSARSTRSVAWGDWNNDGKLDLAVGNHQGQADQVYGNLGFAAGGVPNFVLLWSSQETYNTTAVAWGDRDNDGDLDLAISQDGGGQNGVYENTYVHAAHLSNTNFAADMPLPENPSYISIDRPGTTAAAYGFSSAEVFALTQPLNPPTDTLIIPIEFRVYDPDGSRDPADVNQPGDLVTNLSYEFSLDGGITWRQATTTSTTFSGQSYRLGHSTNPPGYWQVNWNAGSDLTGVDEAVNDNVRFRIAVVHANRAGPIQRAATSAVSPPFRVRKLSCTWPDNPTITISPPISAGLGIQFSGNVSQADGQVTFSWDFGDGVTSDVITQGQIIQHTYQDIGTYPITLRVTGPACPIARQAIASTVLTIDDTVFNKRIYLPLILKTVKPDSSPPTLTFEPPAEPLFILHVSTGSPGQVSGLRGTVQGQATRLEWLPPSIGASFEGYRVYRAAVGEAPYQVIAELPVEATGFSDEGAACGYMYLVTAYNQAGESLPSSNSYFSPPCRP